MTRRAYEPLGKTTAAIVLLALIVVAVAVRALGLELLFLGDLTVFPPADAQYHLRRSLYGFVNYPAVLFWDSYINHPGGAAVAWPPLFDFFVATVATLFASDEAGFEAVAAWVPPALGALTLVPVYFTAREVGGRSVALLAAGMLALFPLSVTYSRVSQVDHHCAVALIGACLLLCCTKLVAGTGRRSALIVGLALFRALILLTWHGSVLYLVLVEATLACAAAVTGRRDLYAAHAISALGTGCLIAPLVWIMPEPLLGPYSAIALSRLHVMLVTVTALVAGGLWFVADRPVASTVPRRIAWTVGLAAATVVAVLALPGPREGLEPGLKFITMTDAVGAVTGEQLPLFEIFGRETGRPAWQVWGALAFLIPLAPFAVLLAPKEKRAAAFVVAAWCAYFGTLAMAQRRFGNDLGPAMAVASAVGIAVLARRATRRHRRRVWAAPALATGIAVALLAPAIASQYVPPARSLVRALSGEYRGTNVALATPGGSLALFLREVRRLTPETRGYFDMSVTPDYGIAAHANLGHALQYVARRPTPADPFWEFIGRENWNRVFSLLLATSEQRGIALARELNARYVLTSVTGQPGKLEGWLHLRDGLRSRGWPASRHFRLVAEGPRGGKPLGRDARANDEVAPYKLFEVVEGAVLQVEAPPGSVVVATLSLETPMRRVLVYEARARASESGVARVRVPYATSRRSGGMAVGAAGPYEVESASGTTTVHVTEDDVREGATIEVGP